MSVAPHDDLPHPVPVQAFMTWKENWAFCAVDPVARIAAVFHVSLRPEQREGIFSAKLAGPGFEHRDVDRHAIPCDPTTMPLLAGKRVSVEVVEPGSAFAVRYRADGVEADLRYDARFPPFDFADGPKAPDLSPLGEVGRSVFPFAHYEQALAVTGTIAVAGDVRSVRGWGNRDHSWGFRDDLQFVYHHWLCASFADRFVQGSLMRERLHPHEKAGGFVATSAGNDAVCGVEPSDVWWLRQADATPPLDREVSYVISTLGGERHTVVAHLPDAIAELRLDARSEDRTRHYADRQVFCEVTLADSGERGCGVLELGRYVER